MAGILAQPQFAADQSIALLGSDECQDFGDETVGFRPLPGVSRHLTDGAIDLASGAPSTSWVSCGAIHAGRPAAGEPRAIDRAMPEAGRGYGGGAYASLVLGKVRGSAVAEGSEFRQQVCQAICRLVAEPANRLGNVELGWL